jgi:hydrogenase expression/formation protein HypD
VTIIPAFEMRIDAFIGPGHGPDHHRCRPYEWIARNEGKPIVVSGFEPVDVLQGIVMLLKQLKAGEAKVENAAQTRCSMGGLSRRPQSHG